jgi:hypothetical protein
MVLGSASNWFSPTNPNKLVEDGQRARISAMESTGPLPDMRQERILQEAELEIDGEIARPPYIHVRRLSEPLVHGT